MKEKTKKELYDERYARENLVKKLLVFNIKNSEDLEVLRHIEADVEKGEFNSKTKAKLREHMLMKERMEEG
jgi:truncated hemoglobin YjbI